MQIRAGLNENGAMSKVSYTGKIGSIIYAPTATALPGTLICDGSAVSRSTYADLFAVLGTTAGSGDGSSTFNLPDLRNVWTVGAGTNAALADVAEGLPNITGRVLFCSPSNSDINIIRFSEGCFSSTHEEESDHGELVYNAAPPPTHRNLLSFNAGNDSAVYGASQHVTPASVALTPCIVYE